MEFLFDKEPWKGFSTFSCLAGDKTLCCPRAEHFVTVTDRKHFPHLVLPSPGFVQEQSLAEGRTQNVSL